MRWGSNVTTPDRPATAFDDLSDAEFDAVLNLIYDQQPLEPKIAAAINEHFWELYEPLDTLSDWPTRDAAGDEVC